MGVKSVRFGMNLSTDLMGNPTLQNVSPSADAMVTAMNNAVEAASIQLLQSIEKFAEAK